MPEPIPRFRLATRADLATLVAMLADDELGSQREDSSQPLNPAYSDAFAQIDADPNNALVVADIDGKAVGMMQLTYIPYLTHCGSWRCMVEGVRVATEQRGLGLGRSLLKHAIECARKPNCRLLQLTSDKRRPEALRFYRSLSFEDPHEGFKLQL